MLVTYFSMLLLTLHLLATSVSTGKHNGQVCDHLAGWVYLLPRTFSERLWWLYRYDIEEGLLFLYLSSVFNGERNCEGSFFV